MAKSTTAALSRLIKQLLAERQQHADGIAAIDEQFEAHGITAAPGRRRKRRGRPRGRKGPGRPRGSKKKAKKRGRKRTVKKAGRKKTGRKKKVGKKRGRKKAVKKKTRRSYARTADEFVLGLLKGGKRLTTTEINGKWKQARRAGTANNTLTKLTKAKKLKRESIKDGRGSTYTSPTGKGRKRATK